MWKEFSKFRDAGREDCLCSEQDHPEFPVQEEGQSRGTEGGPVSTRRQTAFTICDYFRVTGAHDTVLDYADLFSVTLRDDNIQEFDTRWDEVLLSMTKNPSDEMLESLYNWGNVSLRNSNPYYTCTTWKSSEDIDALQSKVENHGKEENRSETSITKL